MRYRFTKSQFVGAIGYVCWLLAAAALLTAQSAKQVEPAVVSHVKVILDKGAPRLEITSSRSITPTIIQADDPSRLFIDLPNAVISLDRKNVPVRSEDIRSIEMQQNATSPPGVRVIVEKRHGLAADWYGAGNRLMIRFHRVPSETAGENKQPTKPTRLTPVSAPVPTSLQAGAVLESSLAPGNPLVAGDVPTTVRLMRGGEIRVCPRSTISLIHSKSGPDLMVSMSEGAVEMHYKIENIADSIMTPDFRILLRGPGEFHYAVRADAQGNTCVRALPGSTGRAIVYELMDNGMYQVTSSNQLFSRTNHVRNAAFPAEMCGCPAPAADVLRASLSEPTLIPVDPKPAMQAPSAPAPGPLLPSATTPSRPNVPAIVPMTRSQETVTLPEQRTAEVRTVLEAPLVYRASEATSTAKPETEQAIAQELDPKPAVEQEPKPKKAHKSEGGGFFRGVKRFFGAIFR